MADVLVIRGHGAPEGYPTPDVTPELHVGDHDAHPTPEDLRAVARLPAPVLSTACSTGSRAFAHAAFDAGAALEASERGIHSIR